MGDPHFNLTCVRHAQQITDQASSHSLCLVWLWKLALGKPGFRMKHQENPVAVVRQIVRVTGSTTFDNHSSHRAEGVSVQLSVQLAQLYTLCIFSLGEELQDSDCF